MLLKICSNLTCRNVYYSDRDLIVAFALSIGFITGIIINNLANELMYNMILLMRNVIFVLFYTITVWLIVSYRVLFMLWLTILGISLDIASLGFPELHPAIYWFKHEMYYSYEDINRIFEVILVLCSVGYYCWNYVNLQHKINGSDNSTNHTGIFGSK